MDEILVYGFSSDLLVLNGAVREEIPVACGEQIDLAFTDGTVLRAGYGLQGPAYWQIDRVAAGSAQYERRAATDPTTDYSDVVLLTGEDLTPQGVPA
jgi:hypothetical protein